MTLSGFYDLVKAKVGAGVQYPIDLATIHNPYYIKDCVWVKDKSDLVTIDSTKTYIITRPVDMGSQQIVVPTNGIAMFGLAPKISKLFSSANNYTMFGDPASGGAGSVRMGGLTFCATGTNSRVFTLNNLQKTDNENNNIDLSDINFVNCTRIGDLFNYRQFFWSLGSIIVSGDLTFSGTWSGGARVSGVKVIHNNSGSTFKTAEGMTFANRFIMDINWERISVSGSVINCSPANFLQDAGLQFLDGQVSPKQTTTNFYFPNMPDGTVKAKFDVIGMPRTTPGAVQNWTAEAATPFPPTGGAVKALGTTTNSNFVWFDPSSPSNASRYISNLQNKCIINIAGSIDSQSGKEIELQLRIWNNDGGAYIILARRIIEASSPARPISSFSLSALHNMNIDDRVELWLSTGLTVTPATIKNGTKILIYAI